MAIEIRELGAEALEEYGGIPIRFRVDSVLRVEGIEGGLGGLLLREEEIEEPYVKDYDEYDEEGPIRWAQRFDVSTWGFFLAYDGDQPGGFATRVASIGGAVVAFGSPGATMLEGRTDLAVLWDIRVHPDRRREGIGTRLFRCAAEWARARGCGQLKIETQNVNVGACRFYASQGCYLGAILRHGYRDPRVAHETMLLWYLDL